MNSFFEEAETEIPLYCSHHLRAGMVLAWNGSFKSAPDISLGVSNTSGTVDAITSLPLVRFLQLKLQNMLKVFYFCTVSKIW